MRALAFMLRRSLKNMLLDLLHHPARLIGYLFVAAMLLFSMLSQALSPAEAGEALDGPADIRLLEGIYLGILLLVMVPSLLMGAKSGASIFNLSDVHFAFVSPIRPKTLLAYGLVKQAGASLLAMLFLTVYGGMMVGIFGISAGFAAGLLAAFAASLVMAQFLAMLIYSCTNGRPARARAVRGIVFGLLLAALVFLGWKLTQEPLSTDSAFAAISSPVLTLLPFAGWMKGLLFALGGGEWAAALFYGGLLAASLVAGGVLFARVEVDYYEDVLQTAEKTTAARTAMREGTQTAALPWKRKTRVGKTGLDGGAGASAFFYRHWREEQRLHRLPLVSGTLLILLIAGLFLSVVMTAGEEPVSPDVILMVTTLIGVYLQLFFTSSGRLSQELQKPWLYLVPASSFQKLLWASMTSFLRPLVDSVIALSLIALIAGADVLVALMCVLVYTTCSWLFNAANVLFMRVFGKRGTQGLLLFLYLMVTILLALPGLIGTIAMLLLLPEGAVMTWAALPPVIWNVLCSLGVFALCRNALDDMEAA